MKTLKTITSTFTAIGETITLNIPNLSEEAAFRFYGSKAEVVLVMIADPEIKSTHPRSFLMTDKDELPENFVKYVATFEFEGTLVHVVEVKHEEPVPA